MRAACAVQHPSRHSSCSVLFRWPGVLVLPTTANPVHVLAHHGDPEAVFVLRVPQ